ncbi:hypothetical protein Droror1_Dr00020719, partial [Drosera rotundifolia]
ACCTFQVLLYSGQVYALFLKSAVNISQYCDWIWNSPWMVLLTKFIRLEWAKETPSAFSQSFTGSKAKTTSGETSGSF